MNILPVSGDGSVLRLSDGQPVADCHLKGEFQLGIRPEDILVDMTGRASALRSHVRYREDLGSHSILAADLSGTMVRITTLFGSQAPDSNVLLLSCPQTKLHLFDTATGKSIAGAFNATTKDQK